ncbi:MAG TPA: divalent-cation tolerance protein CutA [Chloroflexota bacterium]|nr:divalent-cation tolerance protein CutA [Chloroflexota bacterium]
MAGVIQVMTTVDDPGTAQTIAAALIRQRLAACVQILGPITSTYWWQEEIETAEEWLCLVKTTGEHYDDVELLIKQLHPYDVPEVLAIPVVAGSEDYLIWLRAQLVQQGPI